MKYLLGFLLLSILVLSSPVDDQIKLILSVYDLKPKKIDKQKNDKVNEIKIKSGKTFFESTLLSGDRDNACVNCHLDKFGSTDGLPIAVGVKGSGEGNLRYTHGKGILVQRNALALTGRASKEFRSFFWDGRIQIQDGEIISKFGNKLSNKFESALAVAAILPIMERDELIGGDYEYSRNDFSEKIGDAVYDDKYNILTDLVKDRIFNEKTDESLELQKNLKKLNIDSNNFELADVGNLIASFIESKFVLKKSKFDQFLEGNDRALTESEKKGLILFVGKGRCYYCHSGTLFSDFEFHSLGTPQGYFGVTTRHRDLGRAAVTTKFKDFYKFRTPPLVDIKNTAPYGHNGAFPTLYDAVVHHFNPLEFYMKNKDFYNADYYKIGKFINSRDKVLSTIDIFSDEEISQIIDFLNTL